MELTKEEKELVKAYRLGAKIHISYFNIKTYEEAMILMKGSNVDWINDIPGAVTFSTERYGETIRKTVFLDK